MGLLAQGVAMALVLLVSSTASSQEPVSSFRLPEIRTDELCLPEDPAYKPFLESPLSEYEPNQVLLYWPDAATIPDDLANSEQIPLDNLGGAILIVHPQGNQTLTSLKETLQKAHADAVVDLNTRYYPLGGARQYMASQIALPPSDGPAAAIGLVDGMVDAIPALAKAKIFQRDFRDGLPPSANDHASAIASLIAGNDNAAPFHGVARSASIHVAAVMGQDSEGRPHTNVVRVARALDWLMGTDVRVINLSFGGPPNAMMAKLFHRLSTRQVVLVAAMGNSGPLAPPSYPAAYPGVIAVTATNSADDIYLHASQGSHVSLAAPGEHIWVPLSNGGRYVSGTSYAAALVSGTIARILALRPDWNSSATKEHLCLHARDLGPVGIDPVFGCGRVNVGASLAPLTKASNVAHIVKQPKNISLQ